YGIDRVVEVTIFDHVRPVKRLPLRADGTRFALIALRTGRTQLARRTRFAAFALACEDQKRRRQ
ncbi:MAG: hypothetical protein OXN93_09070, partial [bacterium]|nr:hypothetical protein [bacterium]